jgi:purine-binding chemotaxis protein CheW
MNNDTVITQSYLSFKLGDEMFATNVLNVKEILQLTKITKVPHSPSYMNGVINLRGAVLPVVDSRVKFGLPQTETSVHTCIMVLNIEIDQEQVFLGALVDAVLEVLEIDESQIMPSPTIGSRYKSEFITGMIKIQEEFIMLMDMNKVFSTDEISIVQESSQGVLNG